MIGLFFGSFNPIHKGHVGIAKHILDNKLCSEVWFVVSPQNPMKKDTDLMDEIKRAEMVATAIANEDGMKLCDVELKMPKPSYTVDTLRKLSVDYPQLQFAVIMGEDNLPYFHFWKDYNGICENYRILVYPRSYAHTTDEFGAKEMECGNILRIDAPLFPVSSTMIREMIKRGDEVREYLPDGVAELLNCN
ncbi:MAG: nicotinate-nucleotide adenylyltransferase [Culturomica sp.]|jgi:nicotinate-nucleotide adenylyltransferase|nr:nicotinate-nucleotide adenylyltransferase [Culturomica sp.]